ncbi:hypothetical protein BGZ93_009846 [Podila epicladia]|nr:hypothetical protein BGZ92_010489 [Podila epicladia]KAG0089470.1 hypothetical protein BGZ93_009846 [Podila epicladia]
MVERGYLDDHYNVPPLDTFKILSDCNTAVSGGWLCKDTIRSLVSKSIAYLLELSLGKGIVNCRLEEIQSAEIKTFLDIPDDTSSEGNLQIYIGLEQSMRINISIQECYMD